MGRFRTLAVLGVLLSSSPLVGSGCSGNDVTAGGGGATVASVAINGAAEPVAVGGTRQLTVTMHDADGNTLESRPVQWASRNTAVATVNSSTGMVSGVSAGSATIAATYQGIEGTASVTVGSVTAPGGAADPTLLPRATGQTPATGTYGRSLSSGQTYADPNTNVTVLKVTDARTPVANTGMYAGYSEGGPNISQAWAGTDGATYYTLWLAWDDGWFVDVKYPAMTLSNWRRAPVSGETGGAWSLDPATPRIFFYADGSTLNRYDAAAMALANTGRFPVSFSTNGNNLLWLQTQLNDTWIAGMMGSNNTIVAVRPSDGTKRAYSEGTVGFGIDEPHLDREQPVVYVSAANGTSPQNVIYNLSTNARTNPVDTRGIVNDDHNAPMRGKIVGVSWQADATVIVDWQGRVTQVPGVSPTNWNGDFHTAGQWVMNNPSEYYMVDQFQTAGGTWPIKLGMIGMQSMAGDVRLLAAHDASGGGYMNGGQPHPTFAPDGKLVMWTSNMNRSARFDVFLAKVPTR